jgi:hypothetical protein
MTRELTLGWILSGILMAILLFLPVLAIFRIVVVGMIKRRSPAILDIVPDFIWLLGFGIVAGVLVHSIGQYWFGVQDMPRVSRGAAALADLGIVLVVMIAGASQAHRNFRKFTHHLGALLWPATVGAFGVLLGATITAATLRIVVLRSPDKEKTWENVWRGAVVNANGWMGDSTTLYPTLTVIRQLTADQTETPETTGAETPQTTGARTEATQTTGARTEATQTTGARFTPLRAEEYGPPVILLDTICGLIWLLLITRIASKYRIQPASTAGQNTQSAQTKEPWDSKRALTFAIFCLAAIAYASGLQTLAVGFWHVSPFWRLPLSIGIYLLAFLSGLLLGRRNTSLASTFVRKQSLLCAIGLYGLRYGIEFTRTEAQNAPALLWYLAIVAIGAFVGHILALTLFRRTPRGVLLVASMCSIGGLASAPLVAQQVSEDLVEPSYAVALWCNLISLSCFLMALLLWNL